MMNSKFLYLEDMVGYRVPVDALTILLLVHVVRHTNLLSEGKKHNLDLFAVVFEQVHLKIPSEAARYVFML